MPRNESRRARIHGYNPKSARDGGGILKARGTAPLSSQVRPHERSPFWWLRWVPAAIFIIFILDLLYIVGSVAIVPVLASFSLAYLLNPVVQAGEKRGISRPLSAVLAMLLVAVV